MRHSLSLSRNFQTIPVNVRQFLIKALIIFIVWKLLYHLVLVPIHFPDKYLTNITAHTSAYIFNHLLGQPSYVEEGKLFENTYSSAILYVDGRRAVGIADPCNGLELYVLYLGFLFCIPEKLPRKLAFIVLGIAGIFVLNSLRCVGIAWLNLNHVSLVNFAHHYFFKIIIYAAVFFAWVKYSKNYFKHGS